MCLQRHLLLDVGGGHDQQLYGHGFLDESGLGDADVFGGFELDIKAPSLGILQGLGFGGLKEGCTFVGGCADFLSQSFEDWVRVIVGQAHYERQIDETMPG